MIIEYGFGMNTRKPYGGLPTGDSPAEMTVCHSPAPTAVSSEPRRQDVCFSTPTMPFY